MATTAGPLSVDVDLDVTVDGRRCAVWTEGDTIVVNAPTLSTARALLEGVDALPVPQQLLVDELGAAELTVDVRVRHAHVASVGADVAPSRLASLAGYDADVSLDGLAVAAWRALL